MPVTHPSMRRAKAQQSEQPKQEVYVVENSYNSGSYTDNTNVQTHPGNTEVRADTNTDSKVTDMLESLLFLGRVSKTVEIDNMKFEISTLTQKENTVLVKGIYGLAGDSSDLFTIRTITLPYVIKSINNTPLEDLPVEGEFETVYDKKLAIVEQMQRSVVEKLHDEYISLTEESDGIINGEKIKK